VIKVADTVLITGGAGFIGATIARALLEKGHSVVCYDRIDLAKESEMGWYLAQAGIPYIYENGGEITEFPALYLAILKHKVNKIVHAAALTDTKLLLDAPMYSLKVNVLSTLNVLEACRLFGICSVVYCSSIAVYAPNQYEPIDEKHPVHLPDAGPSLYSYSPAKLSAEAFGMQYWADHGVNFTALRFSGVYGFGMKYPIYVKPFLEAAVNGESVKLPTGGSTRRDLIHVKDVANGVVLALARMTSTTPQRIFNICRGGELTSASQVVNMIKKIIPGSDIEIGNGLTPYEANLEKTRGTFNISKANHYLGFEPEYRSIEVGLRDYAETYRQYRKYIGDKIL
jgi:UDP-glucose 4-epimerase